MTDTSTPDPGPAPASGPAPAAGPPRRPVVLRHVDSWDELSGRIEADRAVGLSPSRVRDALTAWFDPGTFTETGTLVRRASASYRGGDTVDDAPNEVPADGLIAGWGRRAGQLVFVAADDPELGSPFRGASGAAKATRMRQHALTQSAPIVQVFGAGRIDPGTFIGAEVVRYGYGVDLDFEVESAERILKIGIVTHPVDAQAALEASWCHMVLLAGPGAAIEGRPGADAVAAGLADVVCDDLPSALAVAGDLLAHLPPSRFDPVPGTGPVDAPGGWTFELAPQAGDRSATRLLTVGPGALAGMVEIGPALAAESAARAARLARFCRDFRLPLALLHQGWARPSAPTARDLAEHRRLGEVLAACPALIEVAGAGLQVERAWGLRPTVTVALGAAPAGDEADLVVERSGLDAALGGIVSSLRIERPRPADDPRVGQQLPRRLQG